MSLAVVRAEDGLHRMRDRIVRDLGFAPSDIDDIARSQGLPTQAAFDIETGAMALPRVTELPPGLEDQIDTLRGHLGRLGSVNPDAPAEYLELTERYEFLVEQSSDLKTAADSLRQVVAELDQVTEERFHRTFEAVATRFAEHFTFLFGGGQSHLVLTEPGDLAHTGVDVRVQPPGKREQGLAVLSGGERALAAVALIFAFLGVSRTPFCLLDEVDATLDEANSVRFRDLLRILARDTQFVVITHNRRTVEAAGTVYGVSMDEHGVSQAISLRLDQVAAAVST
jgi:chromosome segregation protein